MPRVASWDPPRGQNPSKTYVKSMFVDFSPFRSWSRLGPSWEPLGASWGSLGSLLEASWEPLGASWGPLGALLDRSWEPSERSWGHLGGDLSNKGGLLISPAPLECLESPLGHRQEAKILPKPKENQCFVLSRFFALGAVLGHLGRSNASRNAPSRSVGRGKGRGKSLPEGKKGGWQRKRSRPPTP